MKRRNNDIVIILMSDSLPERGSTSNAHLISRIRLIHGDLTKQEGVDAVVAAIDEELGMSNSLNVALIRAAGIQLDKYVLENIYDPKPGDCFALPGFDLKVRHIIYTVMPVWEDAFVPEDRYLLRCYRGAMDTAQKRMKLRRIAFPAMGTGHNRYPPDRAARLALRAILERLDANTEEVRIVCSREDTFAAFGKRLKAMGWRPEK